MEDGRVHSFSSNDPLYTGGGGTGAHDAFSTFTVLFHKGDRDKALIDAGDNWLEINGEPWNKVKQREYMQRKIVSEGKNGDLEPVCLKQYSLKGKSKIMKKKMLDDKYVLNGIAILGQATAIYAKPNTGKTLLVIWLLIEAIKSGQINGEDVYYINADDDFKGSVCKTELAEQYNFEILVPGHEGFETSTLIEIVKKMIDQDSASGQVIILDTLKKFTDLMDKKTSTEFMKVGRSFIAKGGTLILLAHTNKRRDVNNKLIVGGTSDIVDDVDCAYTLDVVDSNNDTKQVLFENIKSRGNVIREVTYSYSIKDEQDYRELLESVHILNDETIEQAKKQKKIGDKLHKNKEHINAITEAIGQGFLLKTELIETAQKNSGISKRSLIKALDEHTGNNYLAGHRWRLEKGEKNSKRYHLLVT